MLTNIRVKNKVDIRDLCKGVSNVYARIFYVYTRINARQKKKNHFPQITSSNPLRLNIYCRGVFICVWLKLYTFSGRSETGLQAYDTFWVRVFVGLSNLNEKMCLFAYIFFIFNGHKVRRRAGILRSSWWGLYKFLPCCPTDNPFEFLYIKCGKCYAYF